MVTYGQAGPDRTGTQQNHLKHTTVPVDFFLVVGGGGGIAWVALFPTARLGSETEITEWRRQTGLVGRPRKHTLARHSTGMPFFVGGTKQTCVYFLPFCAKTVFFESVVLVGPKQVWTKKCGQLQRTHTHGQSILRPRPRARASCRSTRRIPPPAARAFGQS